MKRIRNIILIMLALPLFHSCEAFMNCYEGNGRLTSEERIVRDFTGVVCRGSFDVVIDYDPQIQSVVVSTDENLQREIEVYVSGNDLYLDEASNRCLDPRRGMVVEIRIPYLEYVELDGSGDMEVWGFSANNMRVESSGSGDIDFSELKTGDIEVVASGSGDVTLSGKSFTARYDASGSGDIRANEFAVDEAEVDVSGSGDIYVRAFDLLDVFISGSGDVYFYGNPVIRQQITGSGDLIPR